MHMVGEDLSIERAAPGDIDALAALDRLSAADRRRRERLSEALESGTCWKAVHHAHKGDQNAGYAVLHPGLFYGHPFIAVLYVGETYRRQGVGRALLTEMEHKAGRCQLFTSVGESNRPMRRLLESAGYEPSGIIHNLDPLDPELIFSKLIR